MNLPSFLAWVCLAPLVVSGAAGASAQRTGETTLAKLRDAARPLLIFAPRSDDTRLLTQLHLLQEGTDDLRERDVIPLALPAEGSAATSTTLTTADSEAARRRFHIGVADFVVILIGKDGGEKLRSPQPLSLAKLQEVIDAMPMRRDEMHSRSR